MRQWRVDTPGQTLVLSSDGGIPEVIYWGASLPQAEDLAQVAASGRHDLTGGMVDHLPALSLCPESGRAFQGQPGLICSDGDGAPLHPVFSFHGAAQDERGLCLISRAAGFTLTHQFSPQVSGVLVLKTLLDCDMPIRLQWLAAPVLPAPQSGVEMIDLHGRWAREFQLLRSPWAPGIRMREARTGRSGHEHPPYLILPDLGSTNSAGQVHALHYAWSGGHRLLAEELPDGRRQIQFGAALGAETEAGVHFETAELVVAYSEVGLNGIAATFQRDIRDRVVQWPEPARPRPVHYNCWEAVYFNQNRADLSAIASRAAAIGAERFVLDDGWFGRRDDDTSSLGDWVVDRNKWPDGLHPLIKHVHSLGMSFGIWFEPEMINPDSDLFRAHPDWILGPRDQVMGRNQMVLNLALAPVRDYLFGAVSDFLTEYPADYIKWDHNRLLPVVDAAQTRGIYVLLDRLRAAHPGVEIESCASGGGRIDAGILARTHRVWLSDCIDAQERLRMQHDAALFLPACITGSHVGALHSHTTGRALPMAFRAWVAAQRHFGFEMDLRLLSAADETVLRAVTEWWKANRGWMLAGTILRLDSADPSVTAELQLSADGTRFVVFAGQNDSSSQSLPRPLRLTGLDAGASYRITLRNVADKPPQSRGPNALKDGPLVLSGRVLMGQGVLLPVAWPATMWVLEGERL
jgi:alpha-galactosidase